MLTTMSVQTIPWSEVSSQTDPLSIQTVYFKDQPLQSSPQVILVSCEAGLVSKPLGLN